MEKRLLYRRLMQVCRKFKDYNFREYFLRRSREEFREKAWSLEDSKSFLELLQRQSALQALYPCEKSIIESIGPSRLGKALDSE